MNKTFKKHSSLKHDPTLKKHKTVSKTVSKSSFKHYNAPYNYKGCITNYKNPRSYFKLGSLLTRGAFKYIYTIVNIPNMYYVEIDTETLEGVNKLFEEFCVYILLEKQQNIVKAYDWNYNKIRDNLYICSFFIDKCQLNLLYNKGKCSSEENFLLKNINEKNIKVFMEKIQYLNKIQLPKKHKIFKYCRFLKPDKQYFNVDYKPENICIFKSGKKWDIKLLDVSIDYLHEIQNIEMVYAYSFILFFSHMLVWCKSSKNNLIIEEAKKMKYITAKKIDIVLDQSYIYKNEYDPLQILFYYLCEKNKEKCKTNDTLKKYIMQLFKVKSDT